MYAFLVLLFPIALFRHMVRWGGNTAAHTAWQAAAVAIVLCACKAFMTFSYRVASASFVNEWVYNLLSLTAVPVLCTCVILLIARLRCRSWAVCIDAAFATLASFLAVYLPFTTLSGPRSVYDAYELFFRPPLYLMMATSAATGVMFIAAKGTKRQYLCIALIPMVIVFLTAPSAIDTLWFMNMGNWFVPWCAYMALSFLWYIVCTLKMIRAQA